MKDVGGMGDMGAAKVKSDLVKKTAKESMIQKAMKETADLTEEYIPEPVCLSFILVHQCNQAASQSLSQSRI